jgi:leukotriene-A4 hydrolase
MNGANPDDSFSNVPYEKGFQFISFLEQVLAPQQDIRTFIRDYVTRFAKTSITYIELEAFFKEWVGQKYSKADADAINAKVDWEAWVRQPGANPKGVSLDFSTTGAKQFEDLADAYIQLGGDSSPPNFNIYLEATDPQLKVIFLNRLLARSAEVSVRLAARIDGDLKCTGDKNPEIGQRWYPLAIQVGFTAVLPSAQYYVSYQGRLKYLQPVYRALVNNGLRDVAYQWFILNQNFYHPIAIDSIRAIILQTLPSLETQ